MRNPDLAIGSVIGCRRLLLLKEVPNYWISQKHYPAGTGQNRQPRDSHRPLTGLQWFTYILAVLAIQPGSCAVKLTQSGLQ